MSSKPLDEETIFHTARRIENPHARAEYLDQICAGDAGLRERVDALLEAHERESQFLKAAPAAVPTVDHTPITETAGQQIGRFKLLQKIGEGGFGVVYMAEQVRPVRRTVALKIIMPGMDTGAVVARFEAERQALAMMEHPNIARVLDGGTTGENDKQDLSASSDSSRTPSATSFRDGRPYFVMELVRGVPITEYCDKNALSAPERLKLFVTVCQAVQHAHQKGIIHRDLKPSNILVTLHDGQPVVKVIDFGVAKAINQQLTERTLFTAYGQMVGTPQYMSPEQAEMSGLDIDTRSDIYSLGVLLYEFLTGTTPLEADQLRRAGYAEMQRLIKEQEPQKPSVRLSSTGEKLTVVAKHRSVTPERLHKIVKGDLDWIVMKALDKDRARRYDTALGLADDVQRFLRAEPVNACPPSSSYRIRKFVHRHRAAVITGCVLTVLLLIGIVGTLSGYIRAIAINETLRRQIFAHTTEAIFDAWESGSLTRMEHLLGKQQAHRDLSGFETRFLEARYEECFPARTYRFDAPVRSVAISPDGRCVAVGLRQGGLHIVDIKSGKEIVLVQNNSGEEKKWGGVPVVAFSRQNYLVAAAGTRTISRQLRLWRYTPEKQPSFTELEAPSGLKESDYVTTSVSGRLAANSVDEMVTVWELSSGNVIREIEIELGEYSRRSVVAISPDESLLATASWDKRLRLWNLSTGECVQTLRIADQPFALAFSPDGQLLACSDDTGTHLWDVADDSLVERLPRLSWRRAGGLDFSPDSQFLASAGTDDSTAQVHDLGGTRLAQRYLHHQRVYAVDFSADGEWLATGSADGVVKLWDRRPHALNLRYGYPQWSAPVAVSPNTNVVLFPGEDSSIKVWNTVTGEVTELQGHLWRVGAFAFSADGSAMASGSRDGSIRLWDGKTWEPIHGPELKMFPQTMALSRDARWLAVRSSFKLMLLDRTTEQPFPLWQGGVPTNCMQIDFSPDGHSLAAAAEPGEACVWDVATRKLKGPFPYPAVVQCVQFSPDGRSLVVAGEADEVKVYDVETQSELHTLRGNGSWLTSAAFSPDGDTLVAVSPAGEVRFWRLPSGEEAGTWTIDSGVRRVLFAPDGNALILSSMDGRVEYWRAKPK